VLDGRLETPTERTLAGGPHRIMVTARTPGVLLDALTLRPIKAR
jgi:hypothetical protein